jgi:serine/threonine protein kinase
MIGTSLSHYRIADKLGVGGMGDVYRAEDTNLNRQVTIKVLPDILAGDPERLARFGRAAKLLALFIHPNIAAIHGLEESD